MGVDAVIPPPNPGLNDAADDLRIRDQVENARVTRCHQRLRELARIDAVRWIMRDVHRTHDAVRVWVMFRFRGLMALVADRAVALFVALRAHPIALLAQRQQASCSPPAHGRFPSPESRPARIAEPRASCRGCAINLLPTFREST